MTATNYSSSLCHVLLFVSVRIVLVRLKFGGAIQSCDCFYYSLPGQVTAIHLRDVISGIEFYLLDL